MSKDYDNDPVERLKHEKEQILRKRDLIHQQMKTLSDEFTDQEKKAAEITNILRKLGVI